MVLYKSQIVMMVLTDSEGIIVMTARVPHVIEALWWSQRACKVGTTDRVSTKSMKQIVLNSEDLI